MCRENASFATCTCEINKLVEMRVEVFCCRCFVFLSVVIRANLQARTQLFLQRGGGVHFKLERTLGYQSLKYDI